MTKSHREQWQEIRQPLEQQRADLTNAINNLSQPDGDDPSMQFYAMFQKSKLLSKRQKLYTQIDEMKRAEERGESAILWKLQSE